MSTTLLYNSFYNNIVCPVSYMHSRREMIGLIDNNLLDQLDNALLDRCLDMLGVAADNLEEDLQETIRLENRSV